ncbi:hypothetical protein AVEN_154487-1 [Araneus ventricosus]|uniref:Uncharacterized protein n=1 Tax=Araneus ventricosus TaxID=182803 RepID=A0A4Y2ULL2_ARAVE|nr:hypothetical protein AVEN_154487-1 [Araneus ventricosus]
MNDGCIFGGKADTCKEFSYRRSSHGDLLNPAKQSAVDASEVQPIRKVDKNGMSMDKEMAAIQTSSSVVSPDTYKTLLENLYIARLSFLRARNITMNQLDVYNKEAIEHMQEIKRIIREELENPEASAESLAQDLVQVSTEVIRKQQALNRIEMEELEKNLDSLLNTLRSDVKEVESLAEPEYEEETNQRSYIELIFDYGHWCLFVLYVSIVLSVGLSRYLPAF